MQDELLPCPFCGGTDIQSFRHRGTSYMHESWHVECTAEQCGNGTCHHDTEAEAIAAWNTRAPQLDAMIVEGARIALEAAAKAQRNCEAPIALPEWAKRLRVLRSDYVCAWEDGAQAVEDTILALDPIKIIKDATDDK